MFAVIHQNEPFFDETLGSDHDQLEGIAQYQYRRNDHRQSWPYQWLAVGRSQMMLRLALVMDLVLRFVLFVDAHSCCDG